VFAAGFLFGPLYGAIVALVGSAGAAALGYGGGRLVGTEHLSRWISRRALRMGRQLRGRGALDIAAMRVANATSAHAIHLLSGAGRVPFGAFLSGALVGGLPMVVLVSALGGLFRHTVLDASVWQAVVSTGVTELLVVAGAALRTVILIRQFAPAVAGHRRRTEFG
jgi:phospholipase D1/2